MRPNLVLIHGKPRHPQRQGSVERVSGDIKDMLLTWLADNNTQDWAAGIKFVQFHKNSSYHSGIKCSLYSAMFGCEARIGLTSSSLPREVISTLETEEDLLSTLNNNVSYPADVPTCTNNSGNLATLTDKTDIQIPLTTDNSQQNVSEPTQLDQQLRFIRTYSLSIFE